MKFMDWKKNKFQSISQVMTTSFDIRIFKKHVSDKKSRKKSVTEIEI